MNTARRLRTITIVAFATLIPFLPGPAQANALPPAIA